MERLGGAPKTSILLWPVSCQRRPPSEAEQKLLRPAFD